MNSFIQKVNAAVGGFVKKNTEVLQINIGKKCNQACKHCHVESSPKRTEMMSDANIQKIIELLKSSTGIRTVDITGGAPEIHPRFRYLVVELRSLGVEVIDRCNLTVLLLKSQEGLAQFLAENQVHIIASLPCYGPKNVDIQRGKGVFEKSLRALKLLNDLGYAKDGTGLKLDLVYNPLEGVLPPNQKMLEADYKQELFEKFGISFNELFVITNVPIKRFESQLRASGHLEDYYSLLEGAFNQSTVEHLMCRNTISVSWDGKLYDCDFNQMLELAIDGGMSTLDEVDSFDDFEGLKIKTDRHCFACTAGSGSSCTGALTNN